MILKSLTFPQLSIVLTTKELKFLFISLSWKRSLLWICGVMNGQAWSPCRKTLLLLSLHGPNLSSWGQMLSWSVAEGWKRVIPHPDGPTSQYNFWTHVFLNIITSFFFIIWHLTFFLAFCVISLVQSRMHFAVPLHCCVWSAESRRSVLGGGETVHIVLVAKVGFPKIHNCTASFKQLKITECSSLVWCNFPV